MLFAKRGWYSQGRNQRQESGVVDGLGRIVVLDVLRSETRQVPNRASSTTHVTNLVSRIPRSHYVVNFSI